MSINESLKELGLKNALSYVEKDPEKNIPKLLDWLEKFPWIGERVKNNKEAIVDKNSNWHKLLMSTYTDIDDEVRKKMFENFMINATAIGRKKQNDVAKKNNCNVPWAILMDPTSACNLKCIGCWAAEYGDKLNLTFEELDDIINQAKEMGTHMFIFSGGEPLVRKNDIIKLCEKHQDCVFLAFTNSLLIDEEFADKMLEVKNFLPAISIEGFEEATDARRGKGTYKGIIKSMKILKERKLPFGISCCYTSQNCEVIGSEEYFDQMIEMGAKFAWFFTYIPIGKAAVPELMVSAEQRKFMYEQIRKFRKTKELFTMDFWNDGEYVNGCIAGGRNYLHINANGDIEPCAFIHYSDSNIRDKTLLEAYKSPLFMGYHDGQPFNENELRPCPMLDNPEKICGIVNNSEAKSTDIISKETVEEFVAKTIEPSKKWAPVADELWAKNRAEKEKKGK